METMKALQWSGVVDKSAWVRGPWDDEPDKRQWLTKLGLPGLIVRSPASGALCGYLGVPPEHPWHGLHYDLCKRGDDYVEVHGGLTFSNFCYPGVGDPGKGICHLDPGATERVWWVGFDCAHAEDVTPGHDAALAKVDIPPYSFPGSAYRDLGYVTTEVENLAIQAKEVSSGN